MSTGLVAICALFMMLAMGCGGTEPSGPTDCPQACGSHQTCTGGACVCEAGYRNCDGDPANGCEHQGNTCPSACTAESDESFCDRLGRDCGDAAGLDNCDAERTAVCGSCADGSSCGEDGRCAPSCLAETDEDFCQRLGKECGDVTGQDNCDETRTAACGACADGASCGEDGLCAVSCQAESDEDFCQRLGKNCGDVSGQDNCLKARTAACGICSTGWDCGPENVCELCEPEADEAFCQRLGKDCGDVSGADNCGSDRTANCGSCDPGEACSGANVCVCQAEDDAAFCARLGKNCGPVTDDDDCGDPRTVDCGLCADEERCGLDVPNVCGFCEPETDEGMCNRLGKTCGSVAATDNCMDPRTVECGSCEGSDVCTPTNVCCMPETSASFCSRHGKNCGDVTATDSCGMQRTEDCGTCTGEDVCGPGNVCGPACVPETDAALCQAQSSVCGSRTVTDACGTVRTVDCGTCAGGMVCLGGTVCDFPDGPWLDDFCIPSWGFGCDSSLICVTDVTGFGACKQVCTGDADCIHGGNCATGVLVGGNGFCGDLIAPGGTCESWLDSSDVCFEAAPLAGTLIDCIAGTCSHVCDYEFRSVGAPLLPCPTGQSCGGTWEFSPAISQDVLVCE